VIFDRPRAFGWGVLAILAGCEGSDTQATVRYASNFSSARHTVSVIGVYEDGHISPEAWRAMSAHLAPALGAAPCEVGYNGLVARDDPRTEVIDQFARGERAGDGMLAQLAPAARGDLVLLVRLDGELPQERTMAAGPPKGDAPSSLSSLGRHHGGSMGGMPGRGGLSATPVFEGSDDARPVEADALSVSASFYSVRDSRLVATVSMRYAGQSLDEANARFAALLARAMPETTCVGWSWESTDDASSSQP
jgi:hypothetical protein